MRHLNFCWLPIEHVPELPDSTHSNKLLGTLTAFSSTHAPVERGGVSTSPPPPGQAQRHPDALLAAMAAAVAAACVDNGSPLSNRDALVPGTSLLTVRIDYGGQFVLLLMHQLVSVMYSLFVCVLLPMHQLVRVNS